MKPLISILITTYNRKYLLRRAIDSVLAQTFKNFELIIIDDCSSESPQGIIPNDKRIKYYRNETNQGAENGDRIHIKRFVEELAEGDYFVYLCDDDCWLKDDLLECQLQLFREYPNAAMVAGGQASMYYEPAARYEFIKNVFPKHQTSSEFLVHFSKHPITSNIIAGATLYDMQRFRDSGALSSQKGSKWQAGYELTLGPACYGDYVYIDEPCVLTEIRPSNASFQRTQFEHYWDSVMSVAESIRKPRKNFPERKLEEMAMMAIKNISKAYLANAEHIKKHGSLALCSAENIKRPVTQKDVDRVCASLYFLHY